MRSAATWMLCLLLASRLAGQAGGLVPLWSIGTSDNSSEDLALGPGGHSGFFGRFGDPDEVYYIDHAKARDDFPYALPGPSDEWGGASRWAGVRYNTAQVGFVLDAVNPTQSSVLTLDFVDTAPESPPVLRISVNGRAHDFSLPAGGGGNSLIQPNASSKEHLLQFPIPPGDLRTGYNEISFGVVRGSWVVFDSLRLDAPAGVVMAPARDTIVRGVTTAPYSMQTIDTAGPIVLLDVVQFQRPATLFLEVENSPLLRRIVAPGRTVIEAAAPLSGGGRGRIIAGGSVVYNGIIERRETRPAEPSDYVDPLLGTGRAKSNFAPGPWMPAGLVKVSPDTPGSFGSAGYDFNQTVIHGFSHLHGGGLAGLRITPQSGALRVQPGEPGRPGSGYSSRFRKETEKAALGRYAVRLDDAAVVSELTATTRAVLHRHTFDSAPNARILLDFYFDAETPFSVERALVRRVSETEVEGYVEERSRDLGVPGEQFFRLNFSAQFNRPFKSLGAWNKEDVFEEQEEIESKGDVGAFVELGPVNPDAPVLMRMGLSFVSLENARENLAVELGQPFGWNFEAVAAAQVNAWNRLLRAVELGGDDRREKVRFYSNFYRALAGRGTFSDANGQWVGPDETVRTPPAGTEPVVMTGGGSHFGAQWSLTPLCNLLVPSFSLNRVRTEIALYETGGWLSSGGPALEHVGFAHPGFSLPMLVSAQLAGLKGVDAGKIQKAALDFLRKSPESGAAPAGAGLLDLARFRRHKYVPQDQGNASGSLEMPYLFWAASQAWPSSPKPGPAVQEALQFAGAWRNVFDVEGKTTRPKLAGGGWETPFDRVYTKGYPDSNAAQFTWFVPHDVPGLVKLMGAPLFVEKLGSDLAASSARRFAPPLDQPALVPLTHTNGVSLHVPWLFNWAGQPSQTQKWTREILNRFYGHGPNDGYLGDEHEGRLSSWFVLTSLGLFQTDGGCRQKPVWELTAPRQASATLHFDPAHYPGGTFTIEVRNFNPNHAYIQKAWLNGMPLSRWWITHDEIIQGGSLLFELGPAPNPNWAAFSNLPPQ